MLTSRNIINLFLGGNMIINSKLICSLCSHVFRVRVGIGGESYQKHYFDCSNCDSNLVFAVRAEAPNAHIEVCQNCLIPYPGSDIRENELFNFHPDCAFDLEELHDPFAFPTMKMHGIISKNMRLVGGKYQSVVDQFDIVNSTDKWHSIRHFMMHFDKDVKKAHIHLKKYTTQRNKDLIPEFSSFMGVQVMTPELPYVQGNEYTEYQILHEFFDSIFYPRLGNIVDPIINAINLLDKNKLNGLMSHWSSKLKEENQHRYLNSISDYFKYKDQFGQIMYFSRVDEKVDDLIVSSNKFEKVKLYYGDVYEALTTNFTIIALLNNVLNGREFDKFMSMPLSTYLEVEKSKRSGPFKSNPLFSVFAENDIESTLRNGSHHASIWKDGEKVMYRSGGTGAKREMPYTVYLDMCNKLTIKLASLFLVELYLNEYVNGPIFKFKM